MRKITIHLEGGMIQSVTCEDEIFRIVVKDYDIDPSDDENAIRDSRGKYFVEVHFASTLTPEKDVPNTRS